MRRKTWKASCSSFGHPRINFSDNPRGYANKNRELSGDPNPQYFLKSTAVQMGGVLQYKWEVYCWLSLSSRLTSQGGTTIRMGAILPYQLEVYCSTFPRPVGVGVSETLLKKASNYSGTKKEPKPKLLSPDIFWWGGGLSREGVGAKKFGMSLETQGIKLFWRDIPGFCRDIPEAPEKCEKRMFGFISRPLTMLWGRTILCNQQGQEPCWASEKGVFWKKGLFKHIFIFSRLYRILKKYHRGQNYQRRTKGQQLKGKIVS